MALDVASAARLGANILVRRYQSRLPESAAPEAFWSGNAGKRADELTRLAKEQGSVAVQAGDSVKTVRKQLETALNHQPEFRASVEQEFPDFSFAELFSLLARGYRKPGGSRSKPVAAVPDIRHLVGAAPDQETLEAALFLHQETAARLALALGEALPFSWVQLLELDAIQQSRQIRRVAHAGDSGLAEAQLVGLALSGGGIRSATLNLGILQALADLKLLRYLDYLSTVSGGGYIGSWLHAWIHHGQGSEKNLESVRRALAPEEPSDPDSTAVRPIKWLRRYSNYLAPRLGLLSADVLSIATIWMRNTLLNLLVITLALAAALMVPRGLRAVFDIVHIHGRSPAWIAALAPLGFAVLVIQQNLYSFGHSRARGEQDWFREKWIHILVAFPVVLSAMLVAAWLFEASRGTAALSWAVVTLFVTFLAFLCFVSFGGDYRRHFFDCRLKPPSGLWALAQFAGTTLFYNGLCSAAGALLFFVIEKQFEGWGGDGKIWHCLVLGTVEVTLAYSLVIVLHLGLYGRSLPDDRREWWSRLGAVMVIWMAAWVAVAGASIYGPLLLLDLVHMRFYGAQIAALLGTGWMGTTLAGVMRANSARTGSSADDSGATSWIIRLAPPVFVAGLLLLLALGVLGVQTAILRPPGLGTLDLELLNVSYFRLLSWWGPLESWIAFAFCLGAAYLMALRVDVNEFSMHNFYENRLVRCYLGASNRDRHPNRFTGFDPDDDLLVADLAPPTQSGSPGYEGPYPILNAALNLVSGEELAWQQRKAESFVFTPLFSGYAATPTIERAGAPKAEGQLTLFAYRPTKDYGFPRGGIRLGRATAISGAAASPNQGYHTSAPAAFLMTVFNVRLGWWIGNPRHRKGWRRSGPISGLGYLLVELAAAANNKSKYVYLSDGGHFENLGIYELVRRRCRYIVACDGGQDASFSFEDLGNAIRKCRADFGVEIEIDLSSIRPAAPDQGGPPRSAAHCAAGIINYPDAPRGTLVYLKASLTGDEPADVLEYATLHNEFPHQSTADQFFAESQFESYRRLGYHIGTSVFGEIVKRRMSRRHQDPGVDVDRAGFFSEVRWRWYAVSPKTDKSFTRHAEALTKLMQRLCNDPALAFLDTQISPEWERLMKGAAGGQPSPGLGLPHKAEERRAGFYFCNSLVQLMEDVYLDLNLEEESDHPDNAGWMNLFQHWAWSAMFRATWVISASCYGARFRGFCENNLGLDLASTGRVKIVKAAGFEDSSLNFREKELLAAAGFASSRDELYLAQVLVERPDPPHDVMLELTVGIIVVSASNELVYLRVQEHLRKMGLARRILDAMVVEGQCPVGPKAAWHEPPKDFPEPVTVESQERIERFLDSAHLRRTAAS